MPKMYCQESVSMFVTYRMNENFVEFGGTGKLGSAKLVTDVPKPCSKLHQTHQVRVWNQARMSHVRNCRVGKHDVERRVPRTEKLPSWNLNLQMQNDLLVGTRKDFKELWQLPNQKLCQKRLVLKLESCWPIFTHIRSKSGKLLFFIMLWWIRLEHDIRTAKLRDRNEHLLEC